MQVNGRKILGILLMAFISFTWVACEEEIVTPDEGQSSQTYDYANEPFYNLMKEWYLWYDEMPEINPKDYSNPSQIMNKLRAEKDRWSYVTTLEEFRQYYQQGAYIGYGFGHKWDPENNLRITFVFEDSPLKEKNVSRSWIIRKINGTAVNPSVSINSMLGENKVGETNQFLLESPKGDTVDTTFAKKEIKMNTVLHSSVIEHNGKKTGYLVLQSFIEKTSDELYNAFQNLSSQKISNMVIDLRYNGGGMLEKARETADYVIGQNTIGKVFAQLLHNDKKQNRNVEHLFEEDSLGLAMELSKIYIITTQATASASEALINGLEPFMDVYVIGQKTHGKPVGMYPFTDSREYYAFVPVCFRVANANGESDYYNGLQTDVQSTDDLYEMFGNKNEDCLEQALYHIENGTFNLKKSVHRSEYNKVQYISLRDMIGAQ